MKTEEKHTADPKTVEELRAFTVKHSEAYNKKRRNGLCHVLHGGCRPELSKGALVCGNPPGDPLDVRGEIRDVQGNAIGDALIDVWQAGDDGLYSSQDRTKVNLICVVGSVPIPTAPTILNRLFLRVIRFRAMDR